MFVEDPAWGAAVDDVIFHVTGETYKIFGVPVCPHRRGSRQDPRGADGPCGLRPVHGTRRLGSLPARLSLSVGPLPSDLRLRIWEPPYMEGRPTIAFDYPLGW